MTGKADITVTPNARAVRGGETAQDLFSAEPRWMRNMLIKRTAIWLLALGMSIVVGPLASAQVPSNSNVDYQTPNPSYENGSAPFAESAPQTHKPFFPFHHAQASECRMPSSIKGGSGLVLSEYTALWNFPLLSSSVE